MYRTDDSLLSALISICKILHTPQSAESLLHGLPLVEGKLTPALFIRAANRAGFSSSLVKRPLNQFSKLVLPAILLLKNDKTCILKSINENNLTILFPDIDDGEQTVSHEDLEEEYSGHCLLIKEKHRFDGRTNDSFTPRADNWFWDVIAKSWPIYTEVLIASLLVNCFALASPLFIMNVYDRVVPNHAMDTLWVLAVGVFIVMLFDLILKTLRSYFIDAAGKRSDIILSATIFEKVLGIKMEARPNSVGAFANNLNEFDTFRDFLTSATLTTIIDIPFLFMFLFMIYLIGGDLVYIPMIAIPLTLTISLLLQIPLKHLIQQLFKLSSQKSATLIESLNNIETIKIAGAESQMQREWEQNIGLIAQSRLKSRLLSTIVINFSNFIQQTTVIAIIIYAVYLISEGELTSGGLIACTMLTRRALAPISHIASLFTRYHQAVAALNSINKLMALDVEKEKNKQYVSRSSLKGQIEFKNVTFAYPGQSVNALDNVSFKINQGEKVGFIGRIGSGKTTIEKLMMGLYQPQSGSILLDNTDIRQIDPTDIRRQIGYVPQDISLFYGSVKDNITLGSRYADDHAILKAAEICGVTEFVNRHPSGFDLSVGEAGSALSGGQRQSIAIARALLLSPSVFIMDEPTNAMDNSSEDQFKQKFSGFLNDQTLIIVTHKSSLLTLVDRLVVLDGAKVIADAPKESVLTALKQGHIKVSG